MTILTRRNFIKTAAAASALPLLGRAAFADEPLKVGYIYLGPVGDFGWTWAHEKGRKAMVDHFGGKVVADYVENVNEDQSATPGHQGPRGAGPQADLHDLVRLHGPDARSRQGLSRTSNSSIAPATSTRQNVATYNNRFHEGRAVLGTIAGHDVEDRHDRLSRLVQGARSRDGRELLHAGGAGREPEHQGQAGDDRFAGSIPPRKPPPPKRSPISAATSSPPTPTARPRCRSARRRSSTASARAPTCRASRRMRI